MKRVLALAAALAFFSAPAPAAVEPWETDLAPRVKAFEAAAPDDASRALGAALSTALERYAAVDDYRSLFKKREKNKEGAMGQTEEIFLKFVKPFKILLGWQNTDKKGLQVLYERGKHDDKLGIHKPGLLFGLGPQVVFLPQDSPHVREGSASFDIEDAGIGTFLREFTLAVLAGHAEGKLRVERASAEGSFDVSFPGSVENDVYFAEKVLVRFDPVTGLPVFIELYDWQKKPVGTYEYTELALNLGDMDPVFEKVLHRKLKRIWTHARG